ncbi:hypothetical protein DOTSEDRAFT_34181 [Dothistroma septosporum NZE10]|uniref:ribonuclease H n=1 Tax=Dothistroma septosporum (strain NZE10 / CBS 128990) TaxID=675120 RepID=N1PQK0_DOTSN|nr:hypothetical protein DOTSEDRAFT_34181 [Dothistroma septosporum NZE10]
MSNPKRHHKRQRGDDRHAHTSTSCQTSASSHIVSHVRCSTTAEPFARPFTPEILGYPPTTPIELIAEERYRCTPLVCPAHLSDPACKSCGRRVHHPDCIIITVDGVCPNNGKKSNLIFSAAGVYVGAHSPLNGGYTLVDRVATNQKAELQAGIKGLETALRMTANDLYGSEKIDILVIKTDSKYLHDGSTAWVNKWDSNGW